MLLEKRELHKRSIREAAIWSGRYVTSFVGFMPADDPKFALLVLLDDPTMKEGAAFGGVVAGPVFARIAEKAARYLDLRPTEEIPPPQLGERIRKKWLYPTGIAISASIMQLADLIQRLRAISIDGPVDREITGLRYDSRRVGPGNLFVAVRGSCFDGHSFHRTSVDKGAVAMVGEKPALSKRATMIVVPNSREALARLAATYYGDPSRRLKVIGVTGTNGKSTTTFLVKHLLERANQSTGLIGTVRYEIGERVLPAPANHAGVA